jgi:hypothetical protein
MQAYSGGEACALWLTCSENSDRDLAAICAEKRPACTEATYLAVKDWRPVVDLKFEFCCCVEERIIQILL